MTDAGPYLREISDVGFLHVVPVCVGCLYLSFITHNIIIISVIRNA